MYDYDISVIIFRVVLYYYEYICMTVNKIIKNTPLKFEKHIL
jgi:hypothetical protein